MELIKIKGDKVEANKCQPAEPEHPGCDEQEVKYIQKIQSTVEMSALGELLRLAGELPARSCRR